MTDRVESEVSLAVLLDNARATIAAARDAGIEVEHLGLNQADYDCIRSAKQREDRTGVPPRLLGINIGPDPTVELGRVRI